MWLANVEVKEVAILAISDRELKRRLLQAVKEIREKSPKRNFTESVELQVGIKDVDLNRPENRFRTNIRLAYPIAPKDKIGFFADDAHVTALKKIDTDGEITIIDRAKIEELRSNTKEAKKIAKRTRIFLASQSLMGLIGRYFGRILSPRNKMPIPVPPNADLNKIIDEAKRTIMLRLHKSPSINVKIGHINMKDEEIVENAMTVISAIKDRLPKGYRNISSITLKTTMGPPVKISLKEMKRKK